MQRFTTAEQVIFFLFLVFSFVFCDFVYISLIISWLKGVEPDLVFCCCSPFVSRFDVLFVLRCFSFYHSSLVQSDNSSLVSCFVFRVLFFVFFTLFSVNLRHC